MHVLLIGSIWPEATSSGASLRLLQWVRAMRDADWRVSFASAAAKTARMVEWDAMDVQAFDIALNDDGFDTWISELDPDVVVFDRFMMEEQFGWRVEKHCPNALRVIETIDLHCLREARHQAYKQGRAMCDADVRNDVALREVAAILRSDVSTVISDVEYALLRDVFHVPESQIVYVPYMLYADEIVNAVPGFAERQHMMTMGNFRHAPNWDSVLWLKQAIWPRIRAQLPDAELHIYGAYAPPKTMALHAPQQGFCVRGWAEDALLTMQEYRLCLAPLRFGAGIKSKLADAMLAGTPSVTTSIGAESMHEDMDWCGVIADDVDGFVQAVVDLYQDASAWQQAQQQGYAIVRQVFDAESHAKALVARLKQQLEMRDEWRQQHFMGRMLRHHQHRSTEFMSRWIAEKHKKD